MRIVLSFLLLPGFAFAQGMPRSFSEAATVETEVTPRAAKPGQVVTVKLTVTPQPGWHTYPTMPTIPNQTARNTIGFAKGNDLILGALIDPPGAMQKADPSTGELSDVYDGPVTFEFKAVVSTKATEGKKSIAFDDTRILVCQDSCFNSKPDDVPRLAFEVLPGPALPIPPEYQAAVAKALDTTPTPKPLAPIEPKEKPHAGLIRKNAMPLAEYQAELDSIAASLVQDKSVTATAVGSGLAGLLTAAVFWGFVSLITPCVFPMIPITVSLFLKQAHHSTARTMKFAFVYCLTIIVVLGLSAYALLGTFRELSVSPGMNIFLGALFIVFALSLFGMYDIALPGSWLRATERGRAAGGILGTVFGALAFSIVSFTCVAPFLGGFAGLAATGNYAQYELVLAGLAFATAFASPFFVLAIFPSLLKKLPKSGGWLDTVKAVMGFLELAAAFKFFRTAELRRPPVEYFTYDLVLGSWVVISIVCGLYLLGLFRLPHDEEKPTLSVPRMLFAILFIGLGVYLMPGLFKGPDGRPQRPGGVAYAWVESFLLPEPTEDMPWSADLKAALETARKEKKRVFVDFTGVTCTNCRYNEQAIFPLPGVRDKLQSFVLVQMYTDDVPAEFYQTPPDLAARRAEGTANLNFQKKCFSDERLPLYVILEPFPDGKTRVLGIYPESKINNKDAFAKFLQR